VNTPHTDDNPKEIIMKTRNRTIKLVAAVASLTLVAAACGSDSDDSTPAATDAPVEAPMTTEPMDDMTTEPMDEGDDMDGAALEPSGPLCEAVPADGEGSFEGMTDDPAATAASNNPALSTLVEAVTAAGLVDTLNSDGPFTIFAPANPAFEAIPAADLEAVLADQELLTSILTLHVIAGEQLSSEDLAGMESAPTVNGQDITFAVEDDGTLMVNGQATVGCADVQTSNATVHIIDAVLMPAS
jgi:transforming growth factor-beta-induced protein